MTPHDIEILKLTLLFIAATNFGCVLFLAIIAGCAAHWRKYKA